MIVWLDGAYGCGKTSVAVKVKNSFEEDIVLLESDYYYNKFSANEISREKERGKFLIECDKTPQEDIKFIYFLEKLLRRKQ